MSNNDFKRQSSPPGVGLTLQGSKTFDSVNHRRGIVYLSVVMEERAYTAYLCSFLNIYEVSSPKPKYGFSNNSI